MYFDNLDNHINQENFNVKRLNNKKKKDASRWKWGGCSHNVLFGIEFSQLFLDVKEKAGDIQSLINLHNNQVGRFVSISLHLFH